MVSVEGLRGYVNQQRKKEDSILYGLPEVKGNPEAEARMKQAKAKRKEENRQKEQKWEELENAPDTLSRAMQKKAWIGSNSDLYRESKNREKKQMTLADVSGSVLRNRVSQPNLTRGLAKNASYDTGWEDAEKDLNVFSEQFPDASRDNIISVLEPAASMSTGDYPEDYKRGYLDYLKQNSIEEVEFQGQVLDGEGEFLWQALNDAGYIEEGTSLENAPRKDKTLINALDSDGSWYKLLPDGAKKIVDAARLSYRSHLAQNPFWADYMSFQHGGKQGLDFAGLFHLGEEQTEELTQLQAKIDSNSPVINKVGELGGYSVYAPFVEGAVAKGLGAIGIKSAVPALGKAAAELTGKELGARALTSGVSDAVMGTAKDITQKEAPETMLKNAATNLAGGAALGGSLDLLGKGIGKGIHILSDMVPGLQKAKNAPGKSFVAERTTSNRVNQDIGDLRQQSGFEGTNLWNQTAQKQFVNSAKGAKADNQEIARTMTIAKKLGVPVEFTDVLPKGSNGKYLDGKIYINKNSKTPAMEVFKHELTHHLELSPEYQDFQRLVLYSDGFQKQMKARGFEDLDDYRQALIQDYEEMGRRLDRNGADQELVGNYVATDMFDEFFRDEKAIERLCQTNRSLGQRILDFIRSLRIRLQGTRQEEFLQDTELLYRRGIAKANKTAAKKGKEQAGQEQFSIQHAADDTKYVKVDTDQDIFEGIDPQDYNEIARLYMKDYLRKEHSLGGVDKAFIKAKSAGKYTHPGRKQDYFQEKMRLATELDNVLAVAKKVGEKKATKPNAAYPKFEYYEFDFEIDGEKFRGLLNIGVDKSGKKHLYEVNKIRSLGGISRRSAIGLPRGVSYDSTISQGGSEVNAGLYDMVDIKPKKITEAMTKPEESISAADPIGSHASVIDSTIPQSGSEANNKMRQDGVNYARGGKEKAGQDMIQPPDMRDGETMLDYLGRKYGSMEGGMEPRNKDRVGKLPKQTEDDQKVRKFARTVYESNFTNEEMAGELEQQIAKGKFSYEPSSDQSTIYKAKRFLKNNTYEEAMQEINSVFDSGKMIQREDVARAELLINEAIKKGDYQEASELIQKTALMGTELGQAVQAFSLLKKLSPAGKLAYLEKSVRRLNRRWENKKNFEQIRIPKKLKRQLLKAQGKEAVEQAEEEIIRYIGEHTPVSVVDKLDAWRYLAMLGNPRTHIRNMVGNGVLFLATRNKNLLAALGEQIGAKGAKVAGRNMERTKTVLPASKEMRRFAKNDFKEMRSAIMEGGKGGFDQDIRDYQRVFRSKLAKPVEGLRKANSYLLEKEDVLFSKLAYTDAMSRYMKVNRLSPEFLRSGTGEGRKALARARNYAMEEARKATFREANSLATALNRLEKNHPVSKVLVGGLTPFKKTPVNIMKRGVEYSPWGILQGIGELAHGVKTGKKTAAQAIDHLASGLTGTGVMALGAWLASKGWLEASIAENDKERYYLETQGEQPYALKLGNGTYTIDWLTPVSMPLMMGAELYQLQAADDKTVAGEQGLNRLFSAMTKVSDPMMELSMLQGIDNALSSYGQGIGHAVVESVKSYAGQYVPTLFGQIARTIDPVRRTTYASKDSPLTKTGEQFLRKMGNKIPGLSQWNEPYIDQWGREERTEKGWVRFLENFVSPGYYSKTNTTAVDEEINRLYEKYGETEILPAQASASVTEDNEKYNFTPKEYTEYKRSVGQLSYQSIRKVMQSSAYKKASDLEKQAMILDCYTYGKQRTKAQYLKKKGKTADVDAWVSIAMNGTKYGLTAADVVIAKNAIKDVHGDKDENGKTIYLTASRNKKAAIDQALPGLSLEAKRPLYEYADVSEKVW